MQKDDEKLSVLPNGWDLSDITYSPLLRLGKRTGHTNAEEVSITSGYWETKKNTKSEGVGCIVACNTESG